MTHPEPNVPIKNALHEHLNQLAKEADILSVAWMSWTGNQPTEKEKILLNACCVLCIDHGGEPPSAQVTRITASCQKPLADAVAAGLLTIGPRHGNAGGAAAKTFREAKGRGITPESLVQEALQKEQRLPGFGHPVYEEDPRTRTLLAIEKETLASTPHADYALAVAVALTAAKQKPVPLNIDGALGAVIADLGAPDVMADALFLWARTAGLISHALDASVLKSYLRPPHERR